MIEKILGDIYDNISGIEQLAQLDKDLKGISFDSIQINISGWFDAHLSAVLGAILRRAEMEVNDITVKVSNPATVTALARNDFLPNYGYGSSPDHYGTTLNYEHFQITDTKNFFDDIAFWIKGNISLRQQRTASKRLTEIATELFINAAEHSKSEYGIFTCGQYYPRYRLLKVTFADVGKGFRSRINEHLGRSLDDLEAIRWALHVNNTTRGGATPGGLGLKRITQIVKDSKGSFRIITGSGYCLLAKSDIFQRQMIASFPGTVIIVTIPLI